MHSEVTSDPRGLEELDLICELYRKSRSEKKKQSSQKTFAGMSTGSTDMEHKLRPIHDFKHTSIYLFIETQTG